MGRFGRSLEVFGLLVSCVVMFSNEHGATGQTPDSLAVFFEGKQVVVKA
jgi:hypothetical protein